MISILNELNYPYYNLAFEEYCLGHLPTDETYFILWQNSPAVIFGKNQDLFQEVDFRYAREHGIYLVRRITGGGAVYHDLGNLNISIMGNFTKHPNYAEEYGEAVVRALQAIGLKGVEMNGRNDLYVDGKKVSGWAKRIQGDSFLFHGTLLYDVDLDQLERVLQIESGKMQRKAVKSVKSVVQNIRELLPFQDISQLRTALERELRGQDRVWNLSSEEKSAIDKLVREKYESEEWIYNLSFTPTHVHTTKASCGTIIINLQLAEDTISAINFRGDFLGNKDTDSLCKVLRGVKRTKEAIRERLAAISVASYFSGLSNEDLVNMLCE